MLRTITPAEAARLLREEGATLVDVREPDEHARQRIPGARNLPVDEADRRLGDFASWLTPDTPVLVYCGGADCADALDLALKLREYGFQDLTLYPGGYAEWTEYGGAVRTGGEP